MKKCIITTLLCACLTPIYSFAFNELDCGTQGKSVAEEIVKVQTGNAYKFYAVTLWDTKINGDSKELWYSGRHQQDPSNDAMAFTIIVKFTDFEDYGSQTQCYIENISIRAAG